MKKILLLLSLTSQLALAQLGNNGYQRPPGPVGPTGATGPAFSFSVTGSTPQNDSMRVISSWGIIAAQSGHTFTIKADSNAIKALSGLGGSMTKAQIIDSLNQDYGLLGYPTSLSTSLRTQVDYANVSDDAADVAGDVIGSSYDRTAGITVDATNDQSIGGIEGIGLKVFARNIAMGVTIQGYDSLNRSMEGIDMDLYGFGSGTIEGADWFVGGAADVNGVNIATQGAGDTYGGKFSATKSGSDASKHTIGLYATATGSTGLVRALLADGDAQFNGDIYASTKTRGSSAWSGTNQDVTVTISGATINDLYAVTLTGTSAPGATDAFTLEATSTGFILHRGAAGTSSLTFDWIHVK